MRRSRLSPVSARRSNMRTDYERAKEIVWNRDRGECQGAKVWAEIVCGGRRDPHHVKAQGMWPELRCEPTNMIVLCARHHEAVHFQDPIRARLLGLLY